MSCQQPVCRIVQCTNTGDLPDYFGAYSLQNGTFFTNNLIVVPIPGGGSYELPEGSITIVVPPNPSLISYQGCQGTVSMEVVAGATPAQISSIVSQVMQQVAAQQAVCDNAIRPDDVIYRNIRTSAGCDDGLEMNLIGTLPNGITFNHQGLIVAAGLFSSRVSQAAANLRAQQYVNSLVFGVHSIVQCGWWNDTQTYTCPNSTIKVVPEGTIFSLISQEDANQQALDLAISECSNFWDDLLWRDPDLGTVRNGQTPTFSPADGIKSASYENETSISQISISQQFSTSRVDYDVNGYPIQCASIDYNGPAKNCKLTVTNLSSATPPQTVDTEITIAYFVGGVIESIIYSNDFSDLVNGSRDLFFTLPDTGGITKQVVVAPFNQIDVGSFTLWPASSVKIDGVFSTV